MRTASSALAIPVITVDGPSGVGKGALCQWLATQLGWHLLDSGALYRLTALAALRRGLALDHPLEVAAVAANLPVEFLTEANGTVRILLDGVAVGAELRSETCGDAASRIAALAAVRAALLQRQRDFRRWPGLVADGRDMGSVVFTDAPFKLFLTASSEQRALRRYKQLREKGLDVNLKSLVEEISLRDERDARRAVAPLQPAADAEVLDTTQMNLDQVREWVWQWISQQMALPENRYPLP